MSFYIMAKLALKVLFLLICIHYCLTINSNDESAVNDQNTKNPKFETCKYEKGPWQACDPLTGLQKRILKLTNTQDLTVDCLKEKSLERPCKRQCKYIKGPWSECSKGSKERIDKLRSQVSSSDCKTERTVNKICKKQCKFEKTDWSSCENGIKTRKLTLVENSREPNSADCEPLRTITKACSARNKLRRNSRRKNSITKNKNNES